MSTALCLAREPQPCDPLYAPVRPNVSSHNLYSSPSFLWLCCRWFRCRNHCGVQFAVPQATHEATYEWLLGDENWASIKQARALCSKAYLVRPEVQNGVPGEAMLLPQLLEESQRPSAYEEALSWLEEVERYFGLAADTTVDYASQHLELRTQIVLSHLRRAPPPAQPDWKAGKKALEKYFKSKGKAERERYDMLITMLDHARQKQYAAVTRDLAKRPETATFGHLYGFAKDLMRNRLPAPRSELLESIADGSGGGGGAAASGRSGKGKAPAGGAKAARRAAPTPARAAPAMGLDDADGAEGQVASVPSALPASSRATRRGGKTAAAAAPVAPPPEEMIEELEGDDDDDDEDTLKLDHIAGHSEKSHSIKYKFVFRGEPSWA